MHVIAANGVSIFSAIVCIVCAHTVRLAVYEISFHTFTATGAADVGICTCMCMMDRVYLVFDANTR